MKTRIAVILILLSLNSCGSRKSDTSKYRLDEFNKNEWYRTAPGAIISISAPPEPKMEPLRPDQGGSSNLHGRNFTGQANDTILRKIGENGAQLTVYLSGTRFVNAECNCPPVLESGNEESAREERLKDKQTERESFPWGWFAAGCVASFFIGAYISWKIS